MADNSKKALIFGASGLIGWGVADLLLSSHPETSVFSDVMIAVNRPVAKSDLMLAESPYGPALQIASGVDLRNTTAESLAAQLKEKVIGIGNTTHVFYFVFNAIMEDPIEECQLNTAMMGRVAAAMNLLAPRLESFVYVGGTRGYGIYIPNGTFEAPLVESMADGLPADYERTVAYPHFRRILTEASQGRSWTWTEICPDAVVGFTPNGSAFSLALHWAQYLSLYARNHKDLKNVKVPFPGIETAYHAKFTPVSTRILGEIAVFAALNQSTCSGRILNAADRAKPTTFAELWPKIVADFGMIGIGPVDQDTLVEDDKLKPGEYVGKYKHLFSTANLPRGLTCGVGDGHQQLDHVGTWLTFDRQLSLERLRSVGFEREVDPVLGWLEAMGKFRKAGIIL